MEDSINIIQDPAPKAIRFFADFTNADEKPKNVYTITSQKTKGAVIWTYYL